MTMTIYTLILMVKISDLQAQKASRHDALWDYFRHMTPFIWLRINYKWSWRKLELAAPTGEERDGQKLLLFPIMLTNANWTTLSATTREVHCISLTVWHTEKNITQTCNVFQTLECVQKVSLIKNRYRKIVRKLLTCVLHPLWTVFQCVIYYPI